MTGPANIMPRREALPVVDQMLDGAGGPGWEGLEEKMLPALAGEKLRPDNPVLETLARMWQRPAERAVLEWLLDLTVRAPYPIDHSDFQRMAIAAAKHMARAAVGEAIVLGLQEGRKIIDTKGS